MVLSAFRKGLGTKRRADLSHGLKSTLLLQGCKGICSRDQGVCALLRAQDLVRIFPGAGFSTTGCPAEGNVRAVFYSHCTGLVFDRRASSVYLIQRGGLGF